MIGHIADSFHTADGRHWVTTAQNANNAPLDQAYAIHRTFLATAICG